MMELFRCEQAAREGYLGNYEAGWKGLGATGDAGGIVQRWVKRGHQQTSRPMGE